MRDVTRHRAPPGRPHPRAPLLSRRRRPAKLAGQIATTDRIFRPLHKGLWSRTL